MSHITPTRSLFILVMSCAITCYSGMVLHVTTPTAPQDTTALMTDTLGANTVDTLGTREPSRLAATPQKATSDLTARGKTENKVLQSTTTAKGDKRPGGMPFSRKMTRWFARYPNSNMALLCSIIPGGGQFCNQCYWRMPIALSAMTAGLHAVTWNQRLHNEYHTIYADLLSENPLDHTS